MYTKDGRFISITAHENIEEDRRGWRVDKLCAFVEGEDVGYIKLSFIPRANFTLFYPTVINYQSLYGGRGHLSETERRQTPEFWDRKTQENYMHYFQSDYDLPPDVRHKILEDARQGAPLGPLLKRVNKAHQHHKTKSWKNYKGFEAFHVDKPLVDYIRVYEGEERDPTDKNWQRLGIGMALYQAGRHYANEMGLDLWGSGIQSEMAQGAWAKMTRLGWVKPVGDRRILVDGPEILRLVG